MTEAIVSVKGIGKSFGATRALESVSLDFRKGEILALVGANGAGKSTLIRIICGYYSEYEGEMQVAGRPVRFQSPKEAYQQGIQTVHQIINQGVVQSMTVAENLALEYLLSGSCDLIVRKERVRARAAEIASRMDLRLDLDRKVEELSQSDRQLLVIARTIASDPKLLILDEPTSSISEREAAVLFEKLERLRDQGAAILYVSHRLHEIKRIADRVGVMRDGRISAVLEKPFDVKQIVTAMVGQVREQERRGVAPDRPRRPRLELRGLVARPGMPPLDLVAHGGEVLGITGLIGAGKSEIAEALFGIRRPAAGRVLLDGEEYKGRSIRAAVKAGIHLVPEDRANNAVIRDFSIRHNMTFPFLRRFSRAGLMRGRLERARATEMVKAMGIKCAGESAPIESLSGGNQQKVIVARWLLERSRVLVLDEPFQGVDIRSRRDIGEYLRAAIGDCAVIVLATDLDEILEVADRVVVLNAGRVAGEQDGRFDKETLVHWTSQPPDEIGERAP